ncbi:MAG: MSHA biogenesis protein MshP [Lentisphaeria bacterium]|jgi:MSHA biogenesis protein MshP
MSVGGTWVCKKNKGFLIPLAAFIVFGIGLLAVAINKIASQSSHASVLEGISLQAFYAAETGAQYGMNRLMFDVTDRLVSDANCAALAGGITLNYTAAGLQACSATISCSMNTVAGFPFSFYAVRSEASCGSGEIAAQREIEVSARL